MNPEDIISAIKTSHPKAFDGLTDKAAERIVRATLAEVAKAVNAQAEGILAVKGLGRFAVKMVEKKVAPDGTKVRKVGFRAAPTLDEAQRAARRAERKASA